MLHEKTSTAVDIIVPVYNALADLKLCVFSLKKYVDMKKYRVILIDDCSPDVNIRPYLKKLEKYGFIVLFNEQNLGFSGTVNRGMQMSNSDVILLNSDTIVTSNWVEKMIRCAYSDSNIATVSPLSNAATICSIPHFAQDNHIPQGFTVDQYGAVVERCSLRRYPQLTVTVGFCMYIKRKVIKEIGLFDSKTFQRGYGEENDFCWRANELGYRHVLCDDTFIYHKGTVSFKTEEKKQLIRKHETILKKRYPGLSHQNDVFASADQNWEIRANIELFSIAIPTHKNILYVLHYDFREDAENHIGGTQFHVEDLTMQLKKDYNIYVASRDGDFLRLTLYTTNKVASLKFRIGPVPCYGVFHDEKLATLFRSILSAFHIDLVHVHHVQRLSLDIFYEAHAQNIPLIATAHDFYSVCPVITLLDANNKWCIDRESSVRCAECLSKKLNVSKDLKNYLSNWREQFQKAFSLCNTIITPSDSTKEILKHYHIFSNDRLCTIPHGSDPFEKNMNGEVIITKKIHTCYEETPQNGNNVLRGWVYLEYSDSKQNEIYIHIKDNANKELCFFVQKTHRTDVASNAANDLYAYSGFRIELPLDQFAGGPLRIYASIKSNNKLFSNGKEIKVTNKKKRIKPKLNVAFIGGMAIPKGSQLAAKIIDEGPTTIKWHIFGGINDPKLSELKKRNLIKVGWYDRNHLIDLVQLYQIDVICILPIWPETFSYTLSEALLCKTPVVATDIGAVGERIKQMDCGWLVPFDSSAKEIISTLQTIDRNSEEYKRKKQTVSSIKMRTIKEMIIDYRTLYKKYLSGSAPQYVSLTSDEIYTVTKAYLHNGSTITEDYVPLGVHQDVLNTLAVRDRELELINNSTTYKVLLKLKKLPSPLKGIIKKTFSFLAK